MTKTDDAKNCFRQAALKGRYMNGWLPTTAWSNAIKKTSNREFNNKIICTAINSIVATPESTFEYGSKAFVVFNHRRQVKDGSAYVPRAQFFFVQSSNTVGTPVIPADTAFWQDQVDAQLEYRRKTPYLSPEYSNKLHQPNPLEQPEEFVGKRFEEMAFSKKKDRIKADEKYRFRMNWLKQHDFSGDVDMKGFDPATFSVMNPDVFFEIPEHP